MNERQLRSIGSRKETNRTVGDPRFVSLRLGAFPELREFWIGCVPRAPIVSRQRDAAIFTESGMSAMIAACDGLHRWFVAPDIAEQ